MSETSINIEVSSDEAIVLFEFLTRYSDTDELTVEDQAEQVTLWSLCNTLESLVVEPLKKNFGELLKPARDAIRNEVVDSPRVLLDPERQNTYPEMNREEAK